MDEAKAAAKRVLEKTQNDRTNLKRSQLSTKQRLQMLKEAYNISKVEEEIWKVAKERHELARKLRKVAQEYQRTLEHATAHKIILQWAFDQIPLIEAELKGSQEPEDKSFINSS